MKKPEVPLFLWELIENEDVGLSIELQSLVDDNEGKTARTVGSEAFTLFIDEANGRHFLGIDRYDGLTYFSGK